MSITITRGKFTDMGMPLARERDRNSDWWSLRDDHTPAEAIDIEARVATQIHALLDMEAPAKQVQTPVETDVLDEVADRLVDLLAWCTGIIAKPEPVAVLAVLDMDAPAKQVRHTVTEGACSPITRQPDFFDEGMAWWVSDLGAVGFEAEHYAKAAEVVQDHGFKVRQGVLPSEFGFVVMPHCDEPWSAGMGKRNLAYTLWTIAADAVEVTA